MKNNEIITLSGENGENIDFSLEAEIEYDNETYFIMKPINKDLELEEDEALIFRVDNINGLDYFEMIDDDEIIEAINEIYNEDL